MGAPADPAPPESWHAVARHWPNAAHSNFVRAANLVWHVQRMGEPGAPKCLLLHGTGASTHSFGALMPLLAERFDVLAPDLPGHGFTSEARGRILTLPGMAGALAGLLDALDFAPSIAAGHSAGAAILIEMALTGRIAPAALIGFNGALEPIEGNAIFSPLAKALFVNPFTAHTIAFQARHTRLPRRLLANTGSSLDDATIAHYETLVGMPSHVAGALGMMANWDLEPLQRRLPDLTTPTTLIVNEDDRMVPPRVSRHAATLTNSIAILSLPAGGHLAHESDPRQFSEIIEETARTARLLDAVEAAQ
ncbi:MAG: alpha/beta fold hydrolase [Roseitalea sp.]|jgi:magnesium chelatase accessory protein|nr:alpha/beta fold hydrolase [Roseitalea sp.]MBO6723291.1 alpha/beta fold hydrolase [Roseitalea sp.]MBO6742523.1 alpha/beta fold hydrolase [Roseitalea sp.]